MLLDRPDLTQKVLRSVMARSLTAVVAPMGYGKTTLARSLRDALPGTVLSYAVPAGPHDGHFVWHDMGVAFEAQDPGITPAMRRLGLPETASQARRALDHLRGLGERNGSVTLIIDDYHHVTDPLMDAFLARAARESVPGVRILLLSRSRPGVNIEELRLKRLAALFEQDILAFSQEETAAFFHENGVDAPAAAIESQRYSEGWPAVLWLCLQSWRAGGGAAAPGDIDSLLADAVFAAYSAEERDFLLRLSVFESFTEDDAAALAADAGWLPVSLMELRRKNAFLAFDARTGAYQFHSIFRDFLRKRLAAEARIDKPALYRFAGERCFARRNHVGAFRLFQKAGREEDLLRMLDSFSRFAEDRGLFYFAGECVRAGSAVPWSVRLRNPMGWLSAVALRALTDKDPAVPALLDETEERFRAAAEIPDREKRLVLGEMQVVRAFLSFDRQDTMLIHYTEAVRLLGGSPSRFVSEDFPWNCGTPNLSFITLRAPGVYGDLPEQGARLLHLYNTLSGGKTRDAEELLRAENLLERGDFAGAEPLFADALESCRDGSRQLMGALIAVFGLSRLYAATGCPEKARPLLDALRRRAEELDIAEFFDSLDIVTGYADAVLGRTADIPRWLADGEVLDPPHNVMPQIFGIGLVIHGKALMLRGEWRRLAEVARGIPGTAPFAQFFARIHGLILQAAAAWHIQGRKEALELLSEALELSRPDGLTLIPAEYGAHILPLLRQLKRDGRHGDAHLDAVLALAGRVARGASSPARAPKGVLTPREQELMRHVAGGETNPEIAAQLGVSVNAVKDMLAKARAKLGAFNRMDAAKRFMERYCT